mmetsp:Transcript_73738/g.117555  ORF Transcript_73738/g.117555 Transcript_73738/m.117555 type:complete len:249 (-) Transcript_73738:1412-2158(-)
MQLIAARLQEVWNGAEMMRFIVIGRHAVVMMMAVVHEVVGRDHAVMVRLVGALLVDGFHHIIEVLLGMRMVMRMHAVIGEVAVHLCTAAVAVHLSSHHMEILLDFGQLLALFVCQRDLLRLEVVDGLLATHEIAEFVQQTLDVQSEDDLVFVDDSQNLLGLWSEHRDASVFLLDADHMLAVLVVAGFIACVLFAVATLSLFFDLGFVALFFLLLLLRHFRLFLAFDGFLLLELLLSSQDLHVQLVRVQ